MNPAVPANILSLISDLYGQINSLGQENAQLRELLAQQQPQESPEG